ISRDCNSHELIKQAVKKVLPAEFMAQKIFFAPEGRCSEHLCWDYSAAPKMPEYAASAAALER
ncbi:MAG: hypothetical protein LBD99_05760, partial [Candidatus Margulisbacteria bacterium]|nr:hypothetical protein [Candidatus Margulisiibacteriota bacterium]